MVVFDDYVNIYPGSFILLLQVSYIGMHFGKFVL